ncbi:E3 ubiquitin/ISG15 ligase TRIM25 [Calypte anna]|uniref:E3 ubiquitin/ISG15 ligase TRIM25 n=1 Tax=Calypte anna TaxID=9244 RepID=UPI0011C44750|nr:E3 ubiquitin/ISG15 ligase TRIM25 [Calypte anna]
MAEQGAVPGVEEDLTCPICLGIYREPVSLSCGHSFCKECIQEVRSHRRHPQGPYSCPLCHAPADPDMELQTNVQLNSIAQKFLNTPAHQEEEESEAQHEEKAESLGQQDDVILCDFCLQEPQPAVKTCLTCEASLCQAHLSKHNLRTPLKSHVLLGPCGAHVLAERKCPQHGKPLECFCKTDSLCICMMCPLTSSHKNHEITTLEEAYGQARSVFPEVLEKVKTHKAAMRKMVSKLLNQEEEVKTEKSLQRDLLESLYEEMHRQLDNKKGEELGVLSHNEEQQLFQIQREREKYREQEDAANCDVEKLEALQDQRDPLLFTKAFEVIRARKRDPVPKKADVELPKLPIVLDESTTNNILVLFQQFLSDMQLIFENPPVRSHLTTSMALGEGLAQCSDTVNAPLSRPYYVRKQNRTFHLWTEYDGSNSKNPYRGHDTSYVKSDQSFSEGCHFWDVDIRNAHDCELGIVQSSSQCYLQILNDNLRLFLGKTMIMCKRFPTDLKVVRVQLDCRRNTLSFYKVSPKHGERCECIETVSIPSNYPAHATFSVFNGSLKLL